MTYTIKEVADKFDLSPYTIRYYDKEGLLPFVSKNQNGYREFTESDLGLLHTICCLKNTGMSIKDIKLYIEYCMEGSSTIADRRALLTQQKRQVMEQITALAVNLKEIDKKLETYSSPEAVKIIDEQRRLSGLEKEMYGLENPYKNIG